jgi:hypothetical protein
MGAPADTAVMKTVNARNKKVKESSKKSGVQFEELPTLKGRVNKVGSESLVSNRTICRFDISINPLAEESVCADISFIGKHSLYSAAQRSFSLQVGVKGVATETQKELARAASESGGSLSFEV